ncbi:MAG: pentapeptide repeat-containing protein [Pseudomonadota bacterium]
MMFDQIEKIINCNTDNLTDLAELAAPGDKFFFVGAQFTEADLTDTNLSDFNLRGASFIGANMNKGTILASNADVHLLDLSQELGVRSRELFDEIGSVVKKKVEPSKKKLRRFMRAPEAPAYADKFVETAGGLKKIKHSKNERSKIGNELIWNIFSCMSEIQMITSNLSKPRVSDVVALMRSTERIKVLCDPHIENHQTTNEPKLREGAAAGSSQISRFYSFWTFFEPDKPSRNIQVKKELQQINESIQRIEEISTELVEMLPTSVGR